MPRNPSRSRSREASPERRGPDAFQQVFEMVTRAAEGGVEAQEARERLGDLVRVSARARALDKRLGQRGVAELSPYLQSLLRVAGEPKVVEPAQLRVSA